MIKQNVYTPAQMAGEIGLYDNGNGTFTPITTSDKVWCQMLIGTTVITDTDTLLDLASDHGLGLRYEDDRCFA